MSPGLLLIIHGGAAFPSQYHHFSNEGMKIGGTVRETMTLRVELMHNEPPPKRRAKNLAQSEVHLLVSREHLLDQLLFISAS